MREVMQPRFLAMLCILAVFIPTFFMVGIGRALFPPLALAVGFSMIASYLLSSTLVPVLAALAASAAHGRSAHDERRRLRARARRLRRASSSGSCGTRLARRRRSTSCCARRRCCSSRALGTELFPRVDTGQFQLRIRAPAGTRLERTDDIVRGVDQAIRDEVGEATRRA